MEAPRKDTTPHTSTTRQKGSGFGKFMVDLAGLLTVHIVSSLATYFDFSPLQKEKLRASEYPGQLMVDYMRERGIVSRSDISALIEALEFHKLDGVKLEVISLFNSYLTESRRTSDKFGQLQKCLKVAYELLYKAIQPIPYLRDRMYCVNEVFVEGGIELRNVMEKSESSVESSLSNEGARSKSINSYRDLFDHNVLPSKRIIIEGEPGYGKSTLTLQAAYDWCKEHSLSSVLKDVELFILLQLRLLKDVTSIYKAVKLFILPRDCILTESDIKDIMKSCSSVVIVLDGYDEYPDVNSGLKSDIMEIIKGKMFINYKMILCTRSGCLPSNLDPRTVRVRLTGFDVDARDKYIRKAVVGGSSENINEMTQNLQKNPIMRDLCQNPLFFVMFAHMADEYKDIYKCDSVTSFFKHMIHCFYSHMWKKDEENGLVSRSTTANRSRLHKVAFDGIAGDKQNIVWDKEVFSRNVGRQCFEELVRIGILVQEKFLEVNDGCDVSLDDYIKERHSVRFHHKMFAEWYAAHYLADRASNLFSFRLNETFAKVNPLDLQFVFRFACGLKPSVTKRIVNYLRGIEGGESFAALCILEQTGGSHDILDTVRDMCSEAIQFRYGDNQLLQRSRIQLLSIAAKNKIPIPSVRLIDCFHSVDMKEESIYLSSGLELPRLDTLEELQVYFSYKKDLRCTAGEMLNYPARSVALKTLKFFHLTLLPQSFDSREVLASLHRKHCKVQWLTNLDWLELNLQTGRWEKKDGQELTDDEYRTVARSS